MNIRPEANQPARELPPGESIPVPDFSGQGSSKYEASKELRKLVSDANKVAAAKINACRAKFTNLCISALLPKGEYDRLQATLPPEALVAEVRKHIDLESITSTMKPVMSAPISVPNGPGSHVEETRQMGWEVQLSYEDKIIGTMEVEFSLKGTIEVVISVADREEEG